jgi:3-hydroxyisobutyrate dehydrogenase-like beta-hydroxyacid dehydrogenase
MTTREPIAPPAPVAFIGLGVMAAAMAANTGHAGFALTVQTRTRVKAAALDAMGARCASTPAEVMRAALLGGSARSFVLENHARRIIDGNGTPGFRSELMRKDLRLAAAAARDHGGSPRRPRLPRR